jgi:uncharacterized protein YukE
MSNLRDLYPHAKATKLPGLYIIRRDTFLIQVKAEVNGVQCGWQGVHSGSFKSAVDVWKLQRKACHQRARQRAIEAAKERLRGSRIRLFS